MMEKKIEIYHNPHCSKSREAKQYLENKQIPHEAILYLKTGLSAEKLKNIVGKIGFTSPLELVRTNEEIWKKEFKGKNLTEDEILQAMAENPKLIQRPILIHENKAVIARPTEKIEKIL